MWKQYKNTNYQVTENGQVKSMDKLTFQKGNNVWYLKKGKILKPGINKYGYENVIVTHKEKRLTKLVHTLVAETYLGERPKGKVINHKDGNKLNNKIDNLEYITHKENIQHAWKLGLAKPSIGEKNGYSKLTNASVRDIYNLRKFGLKQNIIADILNVSQQTVSAVLCGVTWKSVIL